MKSQFVLWLFLPTLVIAFTGCDIKPEPSNGTYAGSVYVLYNSALGGINTVKFKDDTVVFDGQLFTGEAPAARLQKDTRNVVGEHSSKIVSDPSFTRVFYDIKGTTGILLGVIAGELYVHVYEFHMEDRPSTRTFKKQE